MSFTIPESLPNNAIVSCQEFVDSIAKNVGKNLRSCIIYGSSVRGNFQPGVSDLNFLIVLHESTPDSHLGIFNSVQRSKIAIEPMIVDSSQFLSVVRCFGAKFLSMRRNYLICYGEDTLANIEIDPKTEKFLVSQSMLNINLRLVHAFVTRRNPRQYFEYLFDIVTEIVVDIVSVFRCAGHEVPKGISERIEYIGRTLEVDVSVLSQLLKAREGLKSTDQFDLDALHSRVFLITDSAVRWMETEWAT